MAAQNVVGLDIGFSSVKAVVLSHKSNPPKLISIGQIPSPSPGIISDADLDLEALATSLKSLLKEVNAPTQNVIIGLQESRIFTRVVYDLPFLTDDELAQAIRYAAEEFVPMPIKDVNLNYQVLFRSTERKGPKSRTVVFVVASPKVLIEKYLKVMQMAEAKVLAIETELIAAARALVGTNPYSPTTLIVELGSSTTDFAVVSQGLILLTRSIATGGIALTRAIAQVFNFELTQADEYKKVYGLLEDQLEGKLFQILKPIVSVMVNEAKSIIQAHQFQNPQLPVKRVVLAGGGAQLPGLVKFIATSLELEVQEADPWSSVNLDQNLKAKLSTQGAAYSVAVGLALRKE
jgi:type IV pilus assembly protein PilM